MPKTKTKPKSKKKTIPKGIDRLAADKFDMRTVYEHPSPDDIAKDPKRYEHWRCASIEPLYAIYAERIVQTDIPGESIIKPMLNIHFRDHSLYLDRKDPDFEAMSFKLRASDDYKSGSRLFCLSDMEKRQAERLAAAAGEHVGLNEKAPLVSLGINNPAQEARIRKALEISDDEARIKVEDENEVLRQKIAELQGKKEE